MNRDERDGRNPIHRIGVGAGLKKAGSEIHLDLASDGGITVKSNGLVVDPKYIQALIDAALKAKGL